MAAHRALLDRLQRFAQPVGRQVEGDQRQFPRA
jgi:hypothetical protein